MSNSLRVEDVLKGDVRWVVIQAHVLDGLRSLPARCTDVIFTSPPYYFLRAYLGDPTIWGGDLVCSHFWLSGGVTKGQTGGKSKKLWWVCEKCGAWLGRYGHEETPDSLGWARGEPPEANHSYVDHTRLWAREVWRVLKNHGSFWLVLGDTRARDAGKGQHKPGDSGKQACVYDKGGGKASAEIDLEELGIAGKNRLGIPWLVALALQRDGWIWRDEMSWIKSSNLPDSTPDRLGASTEVVLRFQKPCPIRGYIHRDIWEWSDKKPEPDWRWLNRKTGEEVAVQPEGWGSEDAEKRKAVRAVWRRLNLWEGRAGYWDRWAVLRPSVMTPQRRLTPRDMIGGKDAHREAHRRPQYQLRDEPGVEDTLGLGRNWRDGDLWRDSLDDLIAQQEEWLKHLRQVRDKQGMLVGKEGEPLGFLVNPQSTDEQFYAAFPGKLVEGPIRVSSSEYGVCAQCGAPWERAVARIVVKERDSTCQNDPSVSHGEGESTLRHVVGWRQAERRGYEMGATDSHRAARIGGLAAWKKACGADASGGYSGQAQKDYEEAGAQNASDVKRSILEGMAESHTVGWRATCGCNAGVRQAVILDPFAGTSRTGQAALKLGRSYIGIELSATYVEISRRVLSTPFKKRKANKEAEEQEEMAVLRRVDNN